MRNLPALITAAVFTWIALPAFAASSLPGYQEIQKARHSYGKGHLKSALKYYSAVPKGSEYWLEALEEQAQAYGRLGQFDKAMANLKTVLAPQFDGLTGPEPFFVMALTQLKVCDYSGTLQTVKQFKKAMKPKVSELENLKSGKSLIAVETVYSRASKTKEIDFSQLGPEAKKLPRNMHRDLAANRAIKKSKSAFIKRVQDLAHQELQEIDKMISKMQIIESEVIQKVNLLVHEKNRQKIGKFAKVKDTLVFPGDEEVWFDELGDFSAEVEKCPTLTQRASL